MFSGKRTAWRLQTDFGALVWSELIVKQSEHGIGPSEPYFVGVVSEADFAAKIRDAVHHVVFFVDRAGFSILLSDQRKKLDGNGGRLTVIAIAMQTLDRDHLQRRPTEGSIPLIAAIKRAG